MNRLTLSKLKCQEWDLNPRPLLRTMLDLGYLTLSDMFALESSALDSSVILTCFSKC